MRKKMTGAAASAATRILNRRGSPPGRPLVSDDLSSAEISATGLDSRAHRGPAASRTAHDIVRQSFAPLPGEYWRDIPGYEGSYQVSSLGRVRSLPRYVPVYDRIRGISYARPCPGVILRQAVCDRAGYVSVHLGKYTRGIPVHQLVMLAFYGYPPPGMEAMHLNGNPKDNRPENLRYGTHSENMTDMYRSGKGNMKLTPEDVRQIRSASRGGCSLRGLAKVYGVSKDCIRDVMKGRRYKWVA